MRQGGRLSRYRVRDIVAVGGETPASLAEGWSVVQIETSVPITGLDAVSFAAARKCTHTRGEGSPAIPYLSVRPT